MRKITDTQKTRLATRLDLVNASNDLFEADKETVVTQTGTYDKEDNSLNYVANLILNNEGMLRFRCSSENMDDVLSFLYYTINKVSKGTILQTWVHIYGANGRGCKCVYLGKLRGEKWTKI